MPYVLANPEGKTAKERRAGWGGSGWISKSLRLAVYLRDNFSCGYCGTDMRSFNPSDVTLDHLKCRSKGGSDDVTNLITACRKCNKGRFTKALKDYATPGAYDRIMRQKRKKIDRFHKMAKALIKGRTGDAKLESK